MKKATGTWLLCLVPLIGLVAQPVTDQEIKSRIERYKTDPRGPFKEIRWYCPDGTIVPPQERCPQPGGVQRAKHKEEVEKLAQSNHIFLGQILATTPFPEFWDNEFFHSRLKQYQLEKFLRASDNGWILRKGQYYRGAYQAEDEERWGYDFFNWLLSDDRVLEENFFLVRQAARDIPHRDSDPLSENIRMVSKLVSDTIPAFLNIRIKIHGQPEASDIQRVLDFKKSYQGKLPDATARQLEQLVSDMEKRYRPFDVSDLRDYTGMIPEGSSVSDLLGSFSKSYPVSEEGIERIELLARLLADLRLNILSVDQPAARLAILDISNLAEELFFREQGKYKASDLHELLFNSYHIGHAAMGCGYLEKWEWEQLRSRLTPPEGNRTGMGEFTGYFEAGRSIADWGSGMFNAVYGNVVRLYSGFEPKSAGFMDDRIRSSILLYAGIAVTQIGNYRSSLLPSSNVLMNVRGQSSARGLNPGYALGELVVTQGGAEEISIDRDKIYVFHTPPADLKPVAGIATVTEGNPVSHVQLLARNLGIPNAVISAQDMEELRGNNGKMVYYAVSPKGVIVMKSAVEMTTREKELFEVRSRKEDKIEVEVERIRLDQTNILNLRNIDATVSGKICGPKAANLAQLKKMFPDHVVEGLVIPFGIFRNHLDQTMLNNGTTYWDFLTGIYQRAEKMRESGRSETEIEETMLGELAKFREALSGIKLSDDFVSELRSGFLNAFKKELGEIPVFLRSDTNMEDLKDFTGAGLNLTLFNVLEQEVILQGIRDVWASPFTERSFRWRQRYLLNPEYVFPSILIIPSVDVDYSGVMVTKGVSSGTSGDITIAFNRGAGGAVDGQAAETYLLEQTGTNLLITPAREPFYRQLPGTGGSRILRTSFNQPLLNEVNLAQLRDMAREISSKLPGTPGVETVGPFDIELGFKNNQLWLFQVRPFVENRNAAGALYLESLDVPIPEGLYIDLKNQPKE